MWTHKEKNLAADTVLDIIAQGAWNGGRLVGNSIYENKGLTFKGGIPVNNQTIEDRIGVRTRIVAPEDERIGVLAFKELLKIKGTHKKDMRSIKTLTTCDRLRPSFTIPSGRV